MRLDPDLVPAAPDLSIESALWSAGIGPIAGIDEAGRGALAGPVAAAVVVLPCEPNLLSTLRGVRDSKALSAQQRETWAVQLREVLRAWEVGFASAREIDGLGILPATRLAIHRALDGIGIVPEHLLIDYILLPDAHHPQTALAKGDARSLSIAAASILAKVARDQCMQALDRQYPHYGFARHKGYGTRAHRTALEKWGSSPIHHKSFAPLRHEAGGSGPAVSKSA